MAKQTEVEKFRKLCRREFRFLENEFDFVVRKLPINEIINQYQVQYNNETTFVAVVGVNWGTGINVRIGRVEPEAWETYEDYDLEDLIKICCADLSLIGPDGFGTSNDQAFQLKHYANALKKCADDVLRGEFAIFPKLHEAIELRAKQFSKGEA